MEKELEEVYTFHFAGKSDIGLVRSRNEDVWGALEEVPFFALADGMGGHQAGDVASREALSHMLSLCNANFSVSSKTLLQSCELFKTLLEEVNARIYQLAKSAPQYVGMGTTFVSIFFHPDGAILTNVGDSRIYRVRNEECVLLTKDHSLWREIVEMGHGFEGFPSNFSYKNVLTKAVGTDSKIDPSITLSDYQEGDFFLLCSDGLTDALSTAQIGTILHSPEKEEEKVLQLISEAKKGGSADNITVVIIHITQNEPHLP